MLSSVSHVCIEDQYDLILYCNPQNFSNRFLVKCYFA